MSNWDCSVEASVGAIVQVLLEYQGAEKQSLSAETIFAALQEACQKKLEDLVAAFGDKIIRKSFASLMICSISWSSEGKRDGAAIVRQPVLSIHVTQQQLLNQAHVLVVNAQGTCDAIEIHKNHIFINLFLSPSSVYRCRNRW
jgi:hypothetical protein